MSEQGKGSMLLPIGIGAGLLLLYFGMKRKEASQPPAAVDPAPLLPELKQSESAAPQIDPAPAPAYTDLSKQTGAEAPRQQDNDNEESQAEEEEQTKEEPGQDDDTEQEQYEDENDPSGQDSQPNYSPKPSSAYKPVINRQQGPNSVYSPAAVNTAVNRRIITTNSRFVKSGSAYPSTQPATVKRKLRFVTQKRPAPVQPAPTAIRTDSQPAPFVSITSNSVAPTAAAAPRTLIFPLKFGITSPYVKEIQLRLRVPATGYFGAVTRTAVLKRFGVTEISEMLYKQIVTGKKNTLLIRKPVVKRTQQPKRPLAKKVIKTRRR